WIFKQVNCLLQNKKTLPTPSMEEIESVVIAHTVGLYSHYGNKVGVRVARKHITWYLKNYKGYVIFKDLLLRADCPQQQQKFLKEFFNYQHTNITELAA
ncbi:MAG: tRNA-dihydrouridine synthase, partial [Gammaproteobacteria bacterium]